jgi:hypothetical protein
MTDFERQANRYLSMTFKQSQGRSDLAAQAEIKQRLDELQALTSRNPRETKLRELLSTWLSDDLAVLHLTRDGFEGVLCAGFRFGWVSEEEQGKSKTLRARVPQVHTFLFLGAALECWETS